MSIHAMANVWATSTQTGGNLLLLLALADYANDRGECWPSVETLARKARVTDRHARRILRELVDAGEIEIKEGGGRNRVNLYRICNASERNPDKMTGVKTLTPTSETLTSEAKNPDAHVSRTIMKHQEPSPAAEPAGASEAFLVWFLELLERTGAAGTVPRPSSRAAWAAAYQSLVDAGETDATIRQACENARGDPFWRTRFLSPVQLTQWNRAGVAYVHVFANLTNRDTAAALEEERVRLEREMTAILRPGGCAYNVAPTGEKLARFELLKTEHARIMDLLKVHDRGHLEPT